MPGARENEQFKDVIIATWPLDEAVDWIGANMRPDEVFTEEDLVIWADENGFVKGED